MKPYNIHSQNGEDGILEGIFRRLKIEKGSCVEFGAWDGKHLSNTFALVQEGWNAVYIEGDSQRFKDLLKTVEEYPDIIPIEAFVSPLQGDKNCLDNLLLPTPLEWDFDLLSIDIDSHDYWVWAFLNNYKPKVVVIEINGTFPEGKEYVQPIEMPVFRNSKERKLSSSSFTSMVKLGNAKGYTLVAHPGNLIFVRNDFAHLFSDVEVKFNTKWLKKWYDL